MCTLPHTPAPSRTPGLLDGDVLGMPAVTSAILPLKFMSMDRIPLPKRCSFFPTHADGAVRASLCLGPGLEHLQGSGWILN